MRFAATVNGKRSLDAIVSIAEVSGKRQDANVSPRPRRERIVFSSSSINRLTATICSGVPGPHNRPVTGHRRPRPAPLPEPLSRRRRIYLAEYDTRSRTRALSHDTQVSDATWIVKSAYSCYRVRAIVAAMVLCVSDAERDNCEQRLVSIAKRASGVPAIQRLQHVVTVCNSAERDGVGFCSVGTTLFHPPASPLPRHSRPSDLLDHAGRKSTWNCVPSRENPVTEY